MILHKIFIFLVFASINYVKGCSPTNPQIATFKKSYDIFAGVFYHTVKTDNSIVISPISINFALTAISLGAGGNTLKEIRNAISQPDDENSITSSYKLVTDNLKSQTLFTTVTKIYADKKYHIHNEFKIKMKRNFDIEVENINLSSDPDGSMYTINDYFDKKTNHRVPKIFDRDSFKETEAIVVNAVHFKSEWSVPFNKEFTTKKFFKGIDGDYTVDMMLNSNTFKYGINKDLEVQLLQLPYKNDFSFMIILPHNRYEINEVENKILSRGSLVDIFDDMREEKVYLEFPKFDFEELHILKPKLRKMGIHGLFIEDNANLYRMSPKMYLSNIYQKAIIRINEHATGFVKAYEGSSNNTHVLVPPRENLIFFKVDRPFIFVIKHDTSRTPLFIGKYVRPN